MIADPLGGQQLARDPLLTSLLERCAFPPPGTAVRCALSGGADSTALTTLAVAAGCHVTAVHARHGLRADDDHDAKVAALAAAGLGARFELFELELRDGPNLEARARASRLETLGSDVLTGHTADDRAETLLLALLRGAAGRGLSGIPPGPTHPIIALRRHETRAVCTHLGLLVVEDPTNDDARFRRNRIRHEVIPLLDEIAAKDIVPNLTRTADLLRDDDQFLDELASHLDPTDARALAAAPVPLARRAIRQWLAGDDLPPDSATVARVLDVAAGRATGCDVGGGRRVERSRQRLSLSVASPSAR